MQCLTCRCLDRSVLAWLALLAAAQAHEPNLDKTPIEVADLYLLDSPQSLAVAPNGKRAVYARQWIDLATREERQSLWLVEGSVENRRPLQDGEPDARSPVFSPDGRWVAIRSKRPGPSGQPEIPPTPPESDTATDIWFVRPEGGPAIALAGPDRPYGRVFNDTFYGRVAFSPDGTRLAFVADDGGDPRTSDEQVAGVQVIRSDQGEGYTGYGPAQVWVAELAAQPAEFAATRIVRLTNDDIWYGDPQWSPDGTSLVVHANQTDDRESVRYSINKNFDLWEIQLADGRQRQLTFGPGPEVSPRFSPAGDRLACLSVPRKGPHADIYNLAVVHLGPEPRSEVVFGAHDAATYDPDDPAPLFPLPDDCWDGPEAIVYQAAAGVRTETRRHDMASGQRTSISNAAGPSAAEHPYESRLARREALTPPANDFLKLRLSGGTRVLDWTSDDGLAIEGLLTVPPVEVASPPYKLLLYPHGGPHSRSTDAFNFTVEVFAAQGYAVFQPNFRGSQGYGRGFLDADRGDLGGGDMQDILTGIESLAKEGLIDPDRQFVYGTSYGGFMTCWLVGHTRQFRAAVAQNPVTDLNAMWGLSDLTSWTEWEFEGRPWHVQQAMSEHSPLTYASKVATPTLLLHSRDDRRCPLPMGRMFHRALQAQGVPTGLVIYPDEGHGIRQPRHREDVLRRALAWFDEHGQ